MTVAGGRLFKYALSQLHEAAGTTGARMAALPSNPFLVRVDTMLSGLGEFTASFTGAFKRTVRFGPVVKTGTASSQLNQETTFTPGSQADTWKIDQKQSESLVAQYV